MDCQLAIGHLNREIEAVETRENSPEKTATIAALKAMRRVLERCDCCGHDPELDGEDQGAST